MDHFPINELMTIRNTGDIIVHTFSKYANIKGNETRTIMNSIQ